MPNVYVEARPKERPNDGPIEDYVVEDRANHVLSHSRTKARPLPGPARKATGLSSPRSRTSARKNRTTGDLPRIETHRRCTD
jgi:hypothetical protein